MLPLPTLHEAVRLTFEEMAFLDIASGPAPKPEPTTDDGPVLYLEYSRPRSGALALFLPKEIKFQVAEAIYGEDWALLSSVQLDDSLLEVLNVLAGRLLTEHFGANTSYTMGLPTVLYDPPEDPPGHTRGEYRFHVDNREFRLVWFEAQP